jgi:hypothetical protein
MALVRLEGLGKLKEKFIHLIKSRNRDLLGCSIIPQSLRYRFLLRSHGSAVGIATGYELNDMSQSSSPGSINNCLSSTLSKLVVGLTQPSIQWVSVESLPKE